MRRATTAWGWPTRRRETWPPPSSRSPTPSTVDAPECKSLQDAWEERGAVRMKLGKARRRARPTSQKCRDIAADTTAGKACADALAQARSDAIGRAIAPSEPASTDETRPSAVTSRGSASARGMSVAELSRVTRIPLASLEAIESDRFDELPGEVFVRGFLKAYAQAVGAGAGRRARPLHVEPPRRLRRRRCRCRRRCRPRARGRVAASASPSRSCCCSSCSRSRSRSCSSRAATTCRRSCRRGSRGHVGRRVRRCEPHRERGARRPDRGGRRERRHRHAGDRAGGKAERHRARGAQGIAARRGRPRAGAHDRRAARGQGRGAGHAEGGAHRAHAPPASSPTSTRSTRRASRCAGRGTSSRRGRRSRRAGACSSSCSTRSTRGPARRAGSWRARGFALLAAVGYALDLERCVVVRPAVPRAAGGVRRSGPWGAGVPRVRRRLERAAAGGPAAPRERWPPAALRT